MFPNAKFRRSGIIALVWSVTVLGMTGCLSGGGSTETAPTAASRPAPAPLGAPQDPEGNSEFRKNDGVDIVNAEAAYLRGATGDGVNVAVIDTGIDSDHPDLANNISAASHDVVTGSSDIEDASGHGTKAAGVIAAERNGLGSHGVAYDANILAIKAATCDEAGCLFHMADLADAVDYASDNLAHVINMSLGGESAGDSELNAAIRRAVNAGSFVVIAAGNGDLPEPYYPANLAADPALAGMVVSVVAVSDSGAIASFSNECGATMNSCLAAPGVSVVTTKYGATDATNTTSASGTSFAAPFVSGALALLIQLYPDAYASDPKAIAMFMFDGARDLGASGVDPVYGHGLLDLAGAMAVADSAISTAALPLSSGTSASLSDTSLALSPAFGDALGSLGLLDNAIAVISLSDGDHPYRARLDDRIARLPRTAWLEAAMTDGGIDMLSGMLGDRLALTMALRDDDAAATGTGNQPAGQEDGEVLAMQLAGTVGDSTGLRLGVGVTAPGQVNAGGAAARAAAMFPSADAMMSPLALLAGRGDGISLEHSVSGTTTLGLGLFGGATEDLLAEDSGAATRLGQVSMTRDFASGGAVRLDAGILAESTSQLGSQGAGAFATGAGASTSYIALSGSLPIGRRVELLGAATFAATDMGESADSMLSKWGAVRSNAFALGAVGHDILAGGDRFGVLLGQPLRAYDASATLTAPVTLDPDGQAVSLSERVDLTPGGREIDLHLVYDRPLAPGLDLSSWFLLQHQPGHAAAAAAEMAAGLRFDVTF